MKRYNEFLAAVDALDTEDGTSGGTTDKGGDEGPPTIGNLATAAELSELKTRVDDLEEEDKFINDEFDDGHDWNSDINNVPHSVRRLLVHLKARVDELGKTAVEFAELTGDAILAHVKPSLAKAVEEWNTQLADNGGRIDDLKSQVTILKQAVILEDTSAAASPAERREVEAFVKAGLAFSGTYQIANMSKGGLLFDFVRAANALIAKSKSKTGRNERTRQNDGRDGK